jgi:2-amino-4-hydroxy-6-hydroxymethyldihydropteridine diphosphokinase
VASGSGRRAAGLGVEVFLSAGSNLGDRRANLAGALDDLGHKGISIARISSFYRTEPVGYRRQPWFLNIAVSLHTCLQPQELLALCREVEDGRGRVRTIPGGPRTVDLDILLFADLILNEPELLIPHPRMTERRFVLVPLAEIAPEAVHPVRKLSIRALLAACPDRSSVIPVH